MDQGTPEWLEWRKQGIGGSDAPAVLGLCPYKTAFHLYQEKVAQNGSQVANMDTVMAKGHAVEAQIRAAFEFQAEMEFPPCLMEHPLYPFLRASLDGWNAETKRGIEIKFVGKEKIELPIPQHHMVQVQYQMLVCGVDAWEYIRSTDGSTFKVETIPADLEMQAKLLTSCVEFWDKVQKKIPPAYEDRDWVPDEREELKDLLNALVKITEKKMNKEIREKIFAEVTHKKTLCNGVKISCNPNRITFPKEP